MSEITRFPFRVSSQTRTSNIFRIRGQRSRWFYPDQRLTPEHCEIMRNIDLSERGVAHSRYGYGDYTNQGQLTGGEPVTGLKEIVYSNGTKKRVVVTPTKIYTDSGTARADITGTALTATGQDRVQFAFLKDQLIINNGVDNVRVWDGAAANTSVLTPVPWTKTKGIFTHKNLLIAFGSTESGTYHPTRVRWCDISRQTYEVDINNWPENNRYEIYDGGAAIVGAVDNWGTSLVFKEDGLYPGEIFYDQLGFFDYRLSTPIRGFSPIAQHSIIARPEFVCGLAQEGIFVIRPDLSFEIANTDDTTDFFKLNQTQLRNCVAYVREREHQVRFLASDTTSGFNKVIVWDWETGDTWIDLPSDTLNYAARIVDDSNVERDLIGTLDGFLYEGNNSAYSTDAGTGFTWRIKMSPNDLGMPGKSKHILNIRTLYRKRAGQQNITFRANFDEGRSSSYEEVITVGTGLQWNEGNLYNAGLKWPGAGALRADIFVNRVCETIAPEWTGDDPASIEGYIVEYIALEG